MASSDFEPLGLRLTSWANYLDQLERLPQNSENMSIFRARFNFASKFQGLTVDGMTSGTLSIYSRVTRIGLCYSALDYLEKVLKIRNFPEILAADVAQEMRNPAFADLVNQAKRGFRSHAAREELTYVMNERSRANVRPMVMILRNSLFHGEFTPAGWQVRPGVRSFKLLDSLAQVTLRHANETFTNWVEQRR